ncbi:hypothetical protein [Streptomyces ipomoeae]|uniref:hypothetical protein n=1 Tax=Streptomyces ipomoeae TaxID=103232 RepID=UPI0011474E87|nr:hypothetical protein [Streptomyces ipomoeae]MDX2936963.1 hypothetical protein [Streptomyces ipomoeae]TQE31379.1 hypothetical protein SipoB123_01915 [Streptomyces ipomoeae]
MSGGRGAGRYRGDRVEGVEGTAEGAAWLASAGTYPRGASAGPLMVACGAVFDVVSAPVVFGRRMLDRLWDEGPGAGPVAVCRGRMLLFASAGTAQRLPALLEWEEWGSPGRTDAVPPLLCHGTGDTVTVPAVTGVRDSDSDSDSDSDKSSSSGGVGGSPGCRWLVAPDTRRPWLPGPEVLLWAAVRAARARASTTLRISIFPPADQGAKVYDVSRRR